MNRNTLWDRSPETEAIIAEQERVLEGGLKFLAAVLAVAWVFSWTTGPIIDLPAPKQAGQEMIYHEVKYQTPEPVLSGVQGPSDGVWRSFWAVQLQDRRQDEDVHSEPSVDRQASVETDKVVAPATTVPVVVPVVWNPADECARVPNPGPVYLTKETMSWCPAVARTLDWWDRHIPGSWEDGELFHLLVSMECESNGDPSAVNPSSGTWGLFQHRPSAWAKRSALWVGIRNAPRTPTNDIIVGVALVNDPVNGQGYNNAWDGCHSHQVVRDTLANGGVDWREHDH